MDNKLGFVLSVDTKILEKSMKKMRDEIENSKNKLDTLNSTFDGTAKTMREINKTTKLLATQIRALTSAEQQHNNLTKAIDQSYAKLNKTTNQSNSGLKENSKNLNKVSSNSQKASKNIGNLTKNMRMNAKGFQNIAIDANRASEGIKSLMSMLTTLSISRALANSIQGAMDYIETVNLFNISMGQYAVETYNLISKISSSSLLDKASLMSATGNYTLLARSMGIANEQATILGRSTTQLALDLASLTNVPIAQVMSDLRSGLLGQTETVYKYGIDLTEASLAEEALRLGISKSIRTMSQGEKMMLRYSLAIRQSTLAHTDFAKTIEEPANQIRILKEQLIGLSRAFGNLFVNTFGKWLPYINGFVSALKVVVETLGVLVGFKAPSVQNTQNNVGSGLEDIGNAAESSSVKVDKLKKKLDSITLPFDELNIINKDTVSNNNGGVLGGSIDTIDFGLEEYSSKLDQIKMKATEIRDRILEWLGYTKKINEVTGEIEWVIPDFKETESNLEIILDLISKIAAGFLGWKLGSSIIKGLSNLANILGVTLPTTLTALSGAWGATVAVMLTRWSELRKESEIFNIGLSRLNDLILNPLRNSLEQTAQSFLNLLPEDLKNGIIELIENFRNFVKLLDLDLSDALLTTIGALMLFNPTTLPIGVLILTFESLTVVIRTLGLLSEETWNKIESVVEKLDKTLNNFNLGIGDVMIAIGGLIMTFFKLTTPVGQVILIFELLSSTLKFLSTVSEETWTKIGNSVYEFASTTWGIVNSVFNSIYNFLEPLLNGIGSLFGDLWSVLQDMGTWLSESFQKVWEEVFTFLKESVVAPFTEFWEKHGDSIISIFSKIGEVAGITAKLMSSALKIAFEIIGLAFKSLGKAIKSVWENIIKPVLELFGDHILLLWDIIISPTLSFIIDMFHTMAGAIVETLNGVMDIILGVFTADWKRAWTGVKNIFFDIWNGIVESFENVVNFFLKGVNAIIGFINKIPGIEIDMVSEFEMGWAKFEEEIVDDVKTVTQFIEQKNQYDYLEKYGEYGVVISNPNSRNISNYGFESKQRSLPTPINYNFADKFSDAINIGLMNLNSNQNSEPIVIENKLYLDGKEIYKNQEQIKQSMGYNLGNLLFVR